MSFKGQLSKQSGKIVVVCQDATFQSSLEVMRGSLAALSPFGPTPKQKKVQCREAKRAEQPFLPSPQVWWQQLSCWLSVNLLTANEVEGEVSFNDIHTKTYVAENPWLFFEVSPSCYHILASCCVWLVGWCGFLFACLWFFVRLCVVVVDFFFSAAKLIKMDISNKLSNAELQKFFTVQNRPGKINNPRSGRACKYWHVQARKQNLGTIKNGLGIAVFQIIAWKICIYLLSWLRRRQL